MSARLPNLSHLRLFLEAARRGSVSGAARGAHLSQPAVTQALVAIEGHMGAPLFVRSHRGLELNATGEAAATRVGRVLELLEEPLGALRGRNSRVGPAGLRGITAAQLSSLAGVAEYGSFAAAALRAGCTRAAVYRGVRQLEALTGARLVESPAGRLLLTRDGERLAQGAQLAAAEMAQAFDEVSQSVGRGGGRSVIGAMPLARSSIVPFAVLAFAAQHPDHAVSILDGPYDSLLAALRRGYAAVLVGALRNPLPADDVEQEHLFDDPLAIIVRARHPLARRNGADLSALAQFPWIAPRAESPLRRQFEALYNSLKSRGLAAPIECNSLVAARGILLGSDRLMLLSEHQVRHELEAGELVALPHPMGPISRPIGLTLRRGWRPTPAQSQLLMLLRNVARNAVDRTKGVVVHGMISPAAPSRARNPLGELPWKRAKKRLK